MDLNQVNDSLAPFRQMLFMWMLGFAGFVVLLMIAQLFVAELIRGIWSVFGSPEMSKHTIRDARGSRRRR